MDGEIINRIRYLYAFRFTKKLPSNALLYKFIKPLIPKKVKYIKRTVKIY